MFDSVVPNQKLSFSALYIPPSDPAVEGKTERLEAGNRSTLKALIMSDTKKKHIHNF